MISRPKPSDVFTPGRIPLDDPNVYAPRRAPEESLSRFIERDQVPVVFGEYGVGKTSMVRRFFQEGRVPGKVVYLPTARNCTMELVHRTALELLNYKVEVGSSHQIEGNTGASLDLHILKLQAGGAATVTVDSELVVKSPTEVGLLRLLEANSVVLIIDEMHNSTKEFRRDLADFVKAVKTANLRYPKIVIIGTTSDAAKLVESDPGIDRYVKELSVPSLTDDEARFIVETGFGRLGLSVAPDLVATIVRTGAGAPTIVQSICLDMAETALKRSAVGVARPDYETAVRIYLDDHGKRLAATYLKAIETFGPKRLRKQVLHAVADVPGEFATLEDVRVRVSSQLGEDVPSTTLSGPLRALKDPRYGEILQDVERFEGGDRVFNLTAFRDPMMKSFVRFMVAVGQEGLAK